MHLLLTLNQLLLMTFSVLFSRYILKPLPSLDIFLCPYTPCMPPLTIPSSTSHLHTLIFTLSPSHSLSHLHTLTFTLSPSLTHLPPLTFTLSPSSSHLLSLIFSISPSPSHLHPLTFSLSPSPSHLHTLTFTLSPPLSHLSLTFTLSPSPSHLHHLTLTFTLSPSPSHLYPLPCQFQALMITVTWQAFVENYRVTLIAIKRRFSSLNPREYCNLKTACLYSRQLQCWFLFLSEISLSLSLFSSNLFA